MAFSKRKKPVKKAVKAKKRKTVINDETCLQHHAWQWAQKAHPELLIFHVANERKGSIGMAMHFKRLGVLAGVADFLAFPPGRSVAIELKDDKGTQNADQEKFQKRWEAVGHLYFVCRTLEQFQGVISALTLFNSR